MAVPYALVRTLEGKRLSLKDDIPEMKKLDPKRQMEFLMQSGMMKGRYLGECLDSCRWGSPTTVMWESSVGGMINYIQNWMKQNEGNFPNLFHEQGIDELYKRFELPHIHHEACPSDVKHKERVRDLAGRVRCAHRVVRFLRLSFIKSFRHFDKFSMMEEEGCWEDEPRKPESDLPDDAWDEKTGKLKKSYIGEYDRLLEKRRKFEEEEPTERVVDSCYAILSDKNLILPLETILKRVNLRSEIVTFYCGGLMCKRTHELSEWEREACEAYGGRCQGHEKKCNYFETPFDGWTLASYVQKWHEQEPIGNAQIFGAKGNDELWRERTGRRTGNLYNGKRAEDFEIRTLKNV